MISRQEAIARRFGAAAASYDAHSAPQRHAASRLATELATLSGPGPARVLEIGCGTGHLSEHLRRALPLAQLVLTDIAPAMLAACAHRLAGADKVRWATMDASRPDQSGPFDLIAGNLVVQWLDDLPTALTALSRCLAPGGTLALSLLGESTFAQWQAAHRARGLTAGTLPLRSRAAYAGAFPPEGTLTLVQEIWHDEPRDGLDFLRSLRAIGADAPAPGHRPLAAGQLRTLLRALGPRPAIRYEFIYALWQAPARGSAE